MGDGELENLERFAFGDSPALADELLALVLAGRKTATCWAVRDGELTHPGKQIVACDGEGRPRAILETVALERRRFRNVDEAFARAEGEGDLSLAWWRDAHRAYFERNGGFSPDMELWCERFRLVRTLGETL
jgi:uncharacterized protein YhfF